MLRSLALVVAALCLAACSSTPPSATPTTSQPPKATLTTSQPPVFKPSLPASGAFDNVYGSYRTDSGDVLVVTRLGWFADLGDSTYRTIYGFGSPGRFSIGPGFQDPTPVV